MTSEPSSPVLRPGLRLVRRCDGLLQAGLRPPHRIGLPDSPPARRLADSLARFAEPLPPGSEDLVGTLAPLIVDGRRLRLLLDRHPGHQGAIAALAGECGDVAEELWDRRRGLRVAVSGPGRWCDLARTLVGEAGMLAADDADADVYLLLYVGEPSSSRADVLLRAGRTHLWAGSAAGEVELGPFVDPGRTPCRRCVVAAESAADPGHALVREQYVGPAGDVPEPEDPVAMTLLTAWAVRALTTWADGQTPVCWGGTARLAAGGQLREHRVGRHPACGCSWTGAWAAG